MANLEYMGVKLESKKSCLHELFEKKNLNFLFPNGIEEQ